MHINNIAKAVESVERELQSQSDPGPRADLPATATIEDGLRCRIESPDGIAIYTDMPEKRGRQRQRPVRPGWHLRAALASCDATLLAMRAARTGVETRQLSRYASKPVPTGVACFSTRACPGRFHARCACVSKSAPAISPAPNRSGTLVHWVETAFTGWQRCVTRRSNLGLATLEHRLKQS